MNGGREVVLDQEFFFALPETTENQNRCVYADLADFDAFDRGGYAKPIGAKFLEGFGGWCATVAVSVAFDDAEHFARRFAFFVRWIDVIADGAEIMFECGEADFSPNRTTNKLSRILRAACHEFS